MNDIVKALRAAAAEMLELATKLEARDKAAADAGLQVLRALAGPDVRLEVHEVVSAPAPQPPRLPPVYAVRPNPDPVPPATADPAPTNAITDEEAWKPRPGEDSGETEDFDKPAAVPVGKDRFIPDELWTVVDAFAAESGISPDLLLAIEVLETGWFTSDAWIGRRNPGGMKNAPKTFELLGIVTDRDAEHPTYLRFASWQEGIRGHAVFIGRGERYKAIHETKDLDAQIDAIGAAGYAEGSPSWLAGVKAKLRQVQVLRAKRIGTRPSTAAVPTDIGAAIVAAAKAAQDLGESFPYEPETDHGRLGCANVVSWILVRAGVLNAILLSVDDVVEALLGLGWLPVTDGKFADGDVIAWKESPESNGHQHIGIIDQEGLQTWALDNSSSKRRVIREDLARNSRAVRCVLRHP